jgi:hypothetical protein
VLCVETGRELSFTSRNCEPCRACGNKRGQHPVFVKDDLECILHHTSRSTVDRFCLCPAALSECQLHFSRGQQIYVSRPNNAVVCALARINAIPGTPKVNAPARLFGSCPDFRRTTFARVLTLYSLYYNETRTHLDWPRTRPCDAQSNDLGRSWPRQYCPDYTIAMRGYDSRERQVSTLSPKAEIDIRDRDFRL